MLVVVALVAAGAALALYLLVERVGRAGIPLALLRAAAWGTVAALLVNPSCGRGSAGTTVLLDQSLSMTDPTGDARWRAAVDSARALAGTRGRILLFGEAPVAYLDGAHPGALTSRLLPALTEAVSRGGPVAIVTDGEVEDATALPSDFLRAARVVLLPRPARTDVGVAGLSLPSALRAGDSVAATADVVWVGATRSDTVLLELLERGRAVARARIGLTGEGAARRALAFVPAVPAGEREARVYEARVSGLAADAEPRDDARTTLAEVVRGPTVALVSDRPDWDFRWLASTLSSSAGTPVRAFVRAAEGPWRDARTLGPVPETAVRAAAASASLLVVHGSEAGTLGMARLARGSVWRWPTESRRGAALTAGDWYVTPVAGASPIGAALAGVPVESLPPLSGLNEQGPDSVKWTGLAAQLGRRGQERPVIGGGTLGTRRFLVVSGSGLWRWAARGGVAAEGYRALVVAAADWLLEQPATESERLSLRRDSLTRGADEFLPRPRTLVSQAGMSVRAAGEPRPLQHVMWVYGAALVALVAEWVARRRKGLR